MQIVNEMPACEKTLRPLKCFYWDL